MRILWQAHETGLSGANICLLEYLEILQSKGFEQHVIVPGDGVMAKEIKEKKMAVSVIPSYPWMKTPFVTEKVSTKLRKVVRKKIAVAATEKVIETFNPDYVATNTIANPIAAYAANNKSKNHVWFVHEFGKEDHGYLIAGNEKKGKEIINRLSQKVVFNSKIIQAQYEQFVEPQKRYIVYNGVNLPKLVNGYKASSANKINMVMLGQIAPSKNPLDALKALKICVDEGLDAELNIVGSAENEEYLQMLNSYIESEHLQKRVHFLGSTKQPEAILIQNDVLLMCSRMEAFGRVTVEAHKCGLPVIAANTGGSVELINEANGYLYQSGNYKDLADKIMKFSESRDRFDKEQIAKAAHEKFNYTNTGNQLLQVFA